MNTAPKSINIIQLNPLPTRGAYICTKRNIAPNTHSTVGFLLFIKNAQIRFKIPKAELNSMSAKTILSNSLNTLVACINPENIPPKPTRKKI